MRSENHQNVWRTGQRAIRPKYRLLLLERGGENRAQRGIRLHYRLLQNPNWKGWPIRQHTFNICKIFERRQDQAKTGMKSEREREKEKRLTPEEAEAEADSDIDIDIDRLALWLEDEAEAEEEAEADLEVSSVPLNRQARVRASPGSSSSHVLKEYHRGIALDPLVARAKLSLENQLARTLARFGLELPLSPRFADSRCPTLHFEVFTLCQNLHSTITPLLNEINPPLITFLQIRSWGIGVFVVGCHYVCGEFDWGVGGRRGD